MTSQICTYDFTLSAALGHDHQNIIDVLKEWTKTYEFQLEQADDGYKHYQGRFSLIKKRRLTEIAKLLQPLLHGIHLSPTSTKAIEDGNSYCVKADTRIEGPWKHDDEVKVLTRQLRHFLTLDLYEWQKEVMGLAQGIDDRSIKLIYDRFGNNGKSILSEFLEYRGLAYEIPPFRLMEDLMQCVMGVKTYPCYLVDMPRGMKKDKLGEFYAGLESIKNGTAYDKRYAFRKKRFDRPQVIVFTNVLPEMELLSRDRWEIYSMTQDGCLTSYYEE